MSDNSLRITFDFKYPDNATLVVYKSFGGGIVFGAEPSISIIKTYIGDEAIEIYSKLSGYTVEHIKKEAGCPFKEKTE